YAAIAVGGHGGNSRRGPEMAAVVFPRVPAKPLAYNAIIERIRVIIAYWCRAGKPGERLAGFIERIGWSKFMETIGAGPVDELIDKRFPETVFRRDLHFRY
ncbi:MAG: hypothetical protein H5T99_05305, partial [Moorella sp. (in: Bacteria)]|nr:hypothetical protein [Moorella sp. (in: firmicutes)]